MAKLHEVEHVTLVHLGQLLAELDGLLPHLRRHRRKENNDRRVLGIAIEAGPSGWPRPLPKTNPCPYPAAHLALVQVAYNLLEEPLLQLLLRPHVLAVSRYQVGRAGFVRPLGGTIQYRQRLEDYQLWGFFFFLFLVARPRAAQRAVAT